MKNSIYVIKKYNKFFGSIDEDTEKIIYKSANKSEAYAKLDELSKDAEDKFAGFADFGNFVMLIENVDLNPQWKRA